VVRQQAWREKGRSGTSSPAGPSRRPRPARWAGNWKTSTRPPAPSASPSRHDTLGPALVATLEPNQFAPTVELKVNFLRPARTGTLVGTGRVVHRGGTIAFLEGDLRDAEGTVVATATATARIVRSG
jgi:hypothetical protein